MRRYQLVVVDAVILESSKAKIKHRLENEAVAKRPIKTEKTTDNGNRCELLSYKNIPSFPFFSSLLGDLVFLLGVFLRNIIPPLRPWEVVSFSLKIEVN